MGGPVVPGLPGNRGSAVTTLVSDELASLLVELRRRHWTLVRWGPEDAPDLVAAVYRWPEYSDVVVIRGELDAVAYRTPTIAAINPPLVVYHLQASAVTVLGAVFGLPAPGEPGAPDDLVTTPDHCRIPEDLRGPVHVRPL